MSLEQRLTQIFKALSIGILLDLLATLLVGILLGMAVALVLLAQGVPEEQLGARMSELSAGAGWMTLSVVLGAAISVGAGFVAAHHLRFNIYPWLGLMGAILALIGFVSLGPDMPRQTAMLLSLVTLASVMSGGRLWDWATR